MQGPHELPWGIASSRKYHPPYFYIPLRHVQILIGEVDVVDRISQLLVVPLRIAAGMFLPSEILRCRQFVGESGPLEIGIYSALHVRHASVGLPRDLKDDFEPSFEICLVQMRG